MIQFPKLKIIFLAIIFFGLFGLARNSLAACIWNGNVGTVSSWPDYAGCLSDASAKSGEVTIVFPAGTYDATTDGETNMTNWNNVTSLTIKGLGALETEITDSRAHQYGSIPLTFRVTTRENQKLRITNIAFNDHGAIALFGYGKPPAGGFRIDNCRWNNPASSYRGLVVFGNTYGVVDSNNVDWGYQFSSVDNGILGAGTGGNDIWANDARPLGSDQAVFFEGNAFVNHSIVHNWMPVDTSSGAKIVVRWNTVSNGYFGGHDASSNNRSQFSWEIYNNDLTTTKSYSQPLLGLRGGTGVAHGNRFHFENPDSNYCAIYGANAPGCLELANYRACDLGSIGPWTQACDGTAVYACLGVNHTVESCDPASPATCGGHQSDCQQIDGNGANPVGYPCRDQLGRTTNQALLPALFWDNKISYRGDPWLVSNPIVVPCAANYTKVNQDYCQADTNMPSICNGVATDYSAYTCPHPLTGLDGACDSSMAGIAGYNIEGSDTTPPASPSGLSVR